MANSQIFFSFTYYIQISNVLHCKHYLLKGFIKFLDRKGTLFLYNLITQIKCVVNLCKIIIGM